MSPAGPLTVTSILSGGGGGPNHNVTTTSTVVNTSLAEDGTTTNVTTTTVRSASTKPVPRTQDNEPIRLSKFSGGYIPNPQTPCKIDTLDWPAPPYPAAVPELRARSRSSSNRRAPSTITSVRGEIAEEDPAADSDADSDDAVNEQELDNEVKQTLLSSNDDSAYQQYLISNRIVSAGGASSVSSSMARAKAQRPNSKFRYRNNLFDNDYNDYLLRYKSKKEFNNLLSKTAGKRYHSGGESEENEAAIANEDEIEKEGEEEEADEFSSPAVKHLEGKIKREIEEISKIEKESSMAAAMLQELKGQERLLSRKLKLDPWKASRAPSANIELPVKTRYESPVNASPSRISAGRSYTLSGTISGHTLLSGPSSTFLSSEGGDGGRGMGSSSNTVVASPTNISLVSPGAAVSGGNRAATLPNNQNAAAASSSSSYLNKNYINSSSRVISNTTPTPKSGNLEV